MLECKALDQLTTLPSTLLQEIQEVYIRELNNIIRLFLIYAAPQALTPDTGVSDSLGAGERTYYEFAFDTDGVTLRLSVTTGTLICYASDLIQNPNEEQGYVWKVTTTNYVDVFLDPDALSCRAGSTLYVGLEGVDNSNTFSLNSTTGDRRSMYN